MYVTLFPCNECAKAIIQAGIKTLSMIVTNMQALRQSLLPRECWTPPVYAIINTREPDAKILLTV